MSAGGRRTGWRALLFAAACAGLGPACATTFKCGEYFECNSATEYCQTTTGGAVSEQGAPSPVSTCMRFAENQPHECPDFTPASGCGCSKDWLTGAVHIGCNLP